MGERGKREGEERRGKERRGEERRGEEGRGGEGERREWGERREREERRGRKEREGGERREGRGGERGREREREEGWREEREKGERGERRERGERGGRGGERDPPISGACLLLYVAGSQSAVARLFFLLFISGIFTAVVLYRGKWSLLLCFQFQMSLLSKQK
jgi:hypothetical protein